MKVKTYDTTQNPVVKDVIEVNDPYAWAEWEIDGGVVRVGIRDGMVEVTGNGSLYNHMVICPNVSNAFCIKFDKSLTEQAMKKKGRR